MGVPLFTNNATGTLAGSYSSGATALTLTAGQGAKFPSPAGGDYFMMTIVDVSNNIEIVKVTARVTDTMTVVRGQEGTSARALGAGEKADLRITAGALDAIKGKIQQTADLADGSVTTNKLASLSVTASKIGLGSVFGIHLTPGAVDASQLALNAAIGNIGFTVVQQGGGTGQGTNKIYLGWSVNKLRAQVDVTDIGYLLTERDDGSASSAGYRGLPVVVRDSSSAFVLTDAGKMVLHTAGSTDTYTVPDDATPFAAGSSIVVTVTNGTVMISPASGVSLVWIGSGASGARNLSANGKAVLTKIGAGLWTIEGTNLT